MKTSGLWKDDKYDCSDWYSGQLMPPPEDGMFWDHVLIGEGSIWKRETHCKLTQDSGLIFWRDMMSAFESKPHNDAIVYFVVSPLEGPAYRICQDDELQAMGGVHALERVLERQSYWFVHVGQIGVKQHQYGVTFQDSELAKLPEPPEDAWQTGRLNPAFGKSEIEKRAFREVFQAIQRMLDTWKSNEGITVEAYALKELKISAQRLMSLTTGLRALKRVHDVLEVTIVKFWYESVWRSKPMPSDHAFVLAEYSFKLPLQLRWATDERLISVEILPLASC